MRKTTVKKWIMLASTSIFITYIIVAHVRLDIEVVTDGRKNVVTSGQSPRVNSQFITAWNTAPSYVPANNIYYVKVHKTGSTTLQNIISRYGFRKNLSFVPFNCMYGMTFPNPPHKRYILENSLHQSYNIVAEHSQFDTEVYKSYMSDKTVVISQLRHPMKFLSSLIGFEYLYDRFNLSTTGDPIKNFLENPMKYDKGASWEAGSKVCTPRQQPSFTKNSMAYHLGYTDTSVTQQSVEKFLSTLDKHLLFVIITEKFDESMILLRRLFGWDLTDVLYLPRGSLAFNDRLQFEVGKNESEKDYLIDLHKHWSPVDYILYDHFHKRLMVTLSQQDQAFWEEVAYFQTVQKTLKDFCSNMCSSVNFFRGMRNPSEVRDFLSSKIQTVEATQWNKELNVSYLGCTEMMLVTEDYQLAIRANEAPAYCSKKSVAKLNVGFNKQFCDKEKHLLFNFPWNYLRDRLFSSYTTCMKFANG